MAEKGLRRTRKEKKRARFTNAGPAGKHKAVLLDELEIFFKVRRLGLDISESRDSLWSPVRSVGRAVLFAAAACC